MYVRDVKGNTCDGSAVPTILNESPATAWVDGNNGLGPVVGNFCMDIAIKKAKDSGVGIVVAKGTLFVFLFNYWQICKNLLDVNYDKIIDTSLKYFTKFIGNEFSNILALMFAKISTITL